MRISSEKNGVLVGMQKQLEVKESIRAMQKDERPREKLFTFGPKALSDYELLQIIIGSGTKGQDVQRISIELLSLIDRKNGHMDFNGLCSIKGLGLAKTAQFLAGMEFYRRRLVPGRKKIGAPGDVLSIVSHYADRDREHFLSVSLNGAHEVMKIHVVSVGILNRTLVHPREVYADAVTERAAAIIVAHNHPSGNIEPSSEDREVTVRLREAGETLGIDLLDHVVFSQDAYYSFLEHGEL